MELNANNKESVIPSMKYIANRLLANLRGVKNVSDSIDIGKTGASVNKMGKNKIEKMTVKARAKKPEIMADKSLEILVESLERAGKSPKVLIGSLKRAAKSAEMLIKR